MNFFQTLQNETAAERELLLSAPIIAKALNEEISLDEYVSFLCQAYHHVKHTVPLLMAAGSQFNSSQEWLRVAVAEYIEEELGHQEWILNDIAACGYDRSIAAASTPNIATELMVAYAYDTIHRVSPLGFFGMVHVLEGTSIQVATEAANRIKSSLNLHDKAFTYLTSHGSLDLEHVDFFASLMNKVTCHTEQATIVHCAKVFYKLYGDIFRSIAPDHGILKLS